MGTPILLLNTKVEMESVLESSDAITGITNANPAVITVGNTYSNGDLIVLRAIVGMPKMNDRVVRVISVSGTEFSAEGVDSTLFGTYVSGGTAEEVSTLLTFDNATSFNFPEPAPTRIDVTTIHDTVKKEIFALDEAAQITLNTVADPLGAVSVELRLASDAKTTRAFRVTLQTGQILIFNAYTAGGRGVDGAVNALAVGNINLTLAAPEQWFAS